jgi:hypothetical protein
MGISNKLFIIHQNKRSLQANLDCFVAEILSWECIPDIIILSEIWINNNEAGFYSINGFDLFLNTNELSYRCGCSFC